MLLVKECPKTGLDKAQADRILMSLKAGNYESGRACRYVKLNNKMGVKTYRRKETRNHCYSTQKAFAELDLAPKTFGKLEIGDLYCYLTEHLDELFSDIDEDDEELYMDELYELKKEMIRHGINDFDGSDDISQNLGFKNGKLIFIDFH